MNIDMLNACVEGYSERQFDLQTLAVWQGYWVGYYQSKKPKPVGVNLEKMLREHKKHKKPNGPKQDVNVEQFMEREARRLNYLAEQERMKQNGAGE